MNKTITHLSNEVKTSVENKSPITLTFEQADEILTMLRLAEIVIFDDGRQRSEVTRAKCAYRNHYDNPDSNI